MCACTRCAVPARRKTVAEKSVEGNIIKSAGSLVVKWATKKRKRERAEDRVRQKSAPQERGTQGRRKQMNGPTGICVLCL